MSKTNEQHLTDSSWVNVSRPFRINTDKIKGQELQLQCTYIVVINITSVKQLKRHLKSLRFPDTINLQQTTKKAV